MNPLKWFKFMTSQKYAGARSAVMLQGMAQAVSTPHNYESLAEEGYARNVAVFQSVMKVASGVSTLRWVLYRRRGKNVVEVESHPLVDLLKRPNPVESRSDLIYATMAHGLIAGDSYLYATEGAGARRVGELWALRPDWVEIIPGALSIPRAYKYTSVDPNGKQTTTIYPVDQVTGRSPILHRKSFHPTNPWYGMARLRPAASSVDSHNEANSMYLALLQNQARPSGALTVEGVMTDDEFNRVKNEINEMYSGSQNTGRPLLLQKGTSWLPLGFSPNDMNWIQGKDTSARDIALAFGVPPQLLGIPGDNTYANYKEARMALYTDTILPMADALKDDLNRWLVSQYGDDLELDYDKDAIEALAPMRESTWDRLANSKIHTINEKREATGYSPVEGGDVILVSGAETPLEFMTEPPDTAPAGDPADEAPANDTQPEGDSTDEETPPADEADLEEETSGGAKSLNLRTERSKKRFWRQTVQLRKQHEGRIRRQISTLFQTEGEHLISVLREKGPHSLMDVAEKEITSHSKLWRAALRSGLTTAGETFAKRTLTSLKHQGATFETKAVSPIFQDRFRLWLDNHLDASLSTILGTSSARLKSVVKRALDENLEAGEGTDAVAREIRDLYDGMSRYRSVMIARTETVAASNFAAEEAARSTGIPNLQKEWIAAEDARTRGFEDSSEWGHAEAHGQRVGINEQFRVRDQDGVWSRMDRPGDPSAPIGQIINCRCTTAFVTEGEE